MAESKTTGSSVLDFGDPNAKQFVTHLKSLIKNKNSKQVVTITQFGDSHTAADFFTGEFRTLMQKRYGNAGIGWLTPIYVKGQHHTAVKWESSNWELFSSRTMDNIDFPMGGFIAKPTKGNATIQISPNITDNKSWQTRVTFKTLTDTPDELTLYDVRNQSVNFSYSPKINQWQTSSAIIKMPLIIKSTENVELGGIWLTRYQQPGVVVSAIATNGAKQSIWQKWTPNWFQELATSQSDLIILEYGTNESFDKTLDLNEYRQNLVSNIRQMRKTLPNAAILLISPPDTMLNEKQAPLYFKEIKNIQKQVAKSEKTLFWDWQKAMGGQSVIKQWLQKGLARPDLVHQTQQGYKESARIFYSDLIEFVGKK